MTRARLAYFERWVDPVAERVLAAAPALDPVRLEFAMPRDELDAIMHDVHGYHVSPRTELEEPWFVDDALIARCPNLLAVCSTGAGFDMIDVEACTHAGILVCNQAGTNTEAVAEHALGFMLALSKRIVAADRALRCGSLGDRFAVRGHDLFGKTVGIVGLGHIGSRVAGLCRGLFGMTVLAVDPYLLQDEMKARGAAKVGLAELLDRSDFVSVHCPRSAETLRMFGRDEFRRMRRSAFFVNTARGGIHCEAALEEALREGWIAGAGLDVFLKEPPPAAHPLLQFDNVIATPHTAGITAESLYAMAQASAEQWLTIFAGERPPRIVNPGAWSSFSARFAQVFGVRQKAINRSSQRS